jgi:hypothetical protein
VLWAGYGVLVQERWDTTLVNSVGTAYAVVYALIFVRYTDTWAGRRRILLVVAGILGSAMAVFVALFAGPVPYAAPILGWFSVVINMGVFLSPLRALRGAVRELDASRVPALFSVASAVSCVNWGCFGLLMGDLAVAAPNLIGLPLSLVQLAALLYIKRQRAAGRAHSELGEPGLEGEGEGRASLLQCRWPRRRQAPPKLWLPRLAWI